jgi:predicted membrane protein
MNHCRTHNVVRITEAELFFAKVKLAGLTILGLVSAVIFAFAGTPP